MDQNPVGASDGRLLSTPKIFAAVVGIIGIALLAFPDPIRKLVDNFGPINPLGSGAHLAIENQKGLTSEPLPLGISVAPVLAEKLSSSQECQKAPSCHSVLRWCPVVGLSQWLTLIRRSLALLRASSALLPRTSF